MGDQWKNCNPLNRRPSSMITYPSLAELLAHDKTPFFNGWFTWYASQEDRMVHKEVLLPVSHAPPQL